MDDTQEQQIAHGLREGRVEAWNALYNAYARPVWQSVARLVGSGSADVADVVQETFLAAARSAHTYDPSRGPLGAWLLGIARRHVALHYRKKEQQDRVRAAAERMSGASEDVIRWLENRQPAPPEIMSSAELAVLVRAALAELPAEYAALLTARYLDDVPVEELAGEHRMSATAVRSKLARARRAFRDIFAKYCPVSPGDPARGTP